jgi:photosystem II stability/assembly factor-like uncharacterized protein
MKKITVSLIILFGTFNVIAQNNWKWMMLDRTQNFYDIQADFQLYYDSLVGPDSKIPKGTGIKQFKRWEYYWQSRVDEIGNFPPAGNTLYEMENWFRNNANRRNYVGGTGTWELLGPSSTPANGTGQLNGNGRLNCIAFHPTDANTIYVGAPSGGFWTSTDNGNNWTQSISGLVRLGVSSIVVHPTTPTTIYIGTGDRDAGDVEGYGVWRSTDGGATWAAYHAGMPDITVNEIIMDPTDPNKMYAGCSNGYVYRTVDGGANWSASNFLGGVRPKDIAFHPSDPSIIYAGTDFGEFHRSTNSGATFTRVTSGLVSGGDRVAIAVSPDQPDYVYALIGDGSGLVGIYRSTNSGASFSARTTTPNILGYSTVGSDSRSQAFYDLVIVADPNDADIIYTGGINLWKSTDGGTNMTCVSYWVGPSGGIDGVHADQHALEFSPHNGNLYNGNDGGIYVTANGGTNWTDISDGLNIAQVYKIGVSQQSYDLGINGYQDNGTAICDNGTFITEIGGDGMECIIDPTDDTYMYGALYYGDIRRSTNGGSTFANISASTGEDGAWVVPYKLDPNSVDRMFAGYKDVWRSDNVKAGTPTWSQITAFSGSRNIRDLAIAQSNSSVMYVSREGASNTGEFYRTNNATVATPTWTNLTANLPTATTPKDIEIDPTDATHLYIALGNDIYESTNSGVSWTNVSGTLPDISLNTIVIDRNSSVEGMYVGMDAGVFYKDNNLADWVAYNSGLPPVEITELEIHDGVANCKGTLYAATYGQGFWKSDLKDPGGVAPVACFDASTTEACQGVSVTLTDRSAYTPTSWSWTITPATYTFIGGTSASSQNPQLLFTAAGSYNITLTATNSTGSDDEVKSNYIVVSAGGTPSDANDNFESYALCGTASDCGTTSCALSGSLWSNLSNGTEDDIDWRLDEGGTPSANTGPAVDYNPGSATGNYLYLEASSCFSADAILQSECITLDSLYDFSFAYHMYGANMGELHVDIQYNGEWIEDVIPAISGDQSNAWFTKTIDLSTYVGSTIKIRFRGLTGGGFASDVALDDLKFTPRHYWTGTISTDWSVAGNWNRGTVPTAADDVYITSAPVNQPHITTPAASFATCADLNISSGATLTVDAGKAFTVAGDIANEGTILVKADATGIGSFIDNGTISGSGSFQMEQYLTGAGGATPNGLFYYVSNPVVGATAASYDVASGNKLWFADEVNQNYPQINNGSIVLDPAQGYVVRMGSTGVLTLSGTSFNTDDQSASGLTRTGTSAVNRGYNLVGNPYPSTVSWDAASKINLETTLWYRTHQGSTMLYDTYNATSGFGTDNNGNGAVTGAIAPTQGFWVRVNADGNTGQLDFTNAMRSHGALAGIYKIEVAEGTVRMTLSNGVNSDETILFFNSDADDDYDSFDSQKFWASLSIPQVYTAVGTDSLVINGMNSIATNPIVDLGVKLPSAGSYTLSANEITVVNESVHLEDRMLGIFQNLTEEPNYNFTSNVGGNVRNRFALHFGMSVTGVEEGSDMNSRVYTTDQNQLNIILAENVANGSLEVVDMTGRLVNTSSINSNQTSITMNVKGGVYLIRITTDKGTDTHRVVLQ